MWKNNCLIGNDFKPFLILNYHHQLWDKKRRATYKFKKMDYLNFLGDFKTCEKQNIFMIRFNLWIKLCSNIPGVFQRKVSVLVLFFESR